MRPTSRLTNVILFAALIGFAAFSQQFVEDPPYPVTPMHGVLTVLLGTIGLITLKQSKTGLIVGSSFLCMALLNGLYPDLWLRWPQLSVLSLVITGGSSLVLSKQKPHFKISVLLAGILAFCQSLVLIVVYFPELFSSRLLLLNIGISVVALVWIIISARIHAETMPWVRFLSLWLILAFLVGISWNPLTITGRMLAEYVLAGASLIYAVGILARIKLQPDEHAEKKIKI